MSNFWLYFRIQSKASYASKNWNFKKIPKKSESRTFGPCRAVNLQVCNIQIFENVGILSRRFFDFWRRFFQLPPSQLFFSLCLALNWSKLQWFWWIWVTDFKDPVCLSLFSSQKKIENRFRIPVTLAFWSYKSFCWFLLDLPKNKALKDVGPKTHNVQIWSLKPLIF